ncbi:MAG: hypothetical protein IPH34_16275 [Chitinophagaceae bacterium]|nr:hypothetical protein [Chitinophagaceae bacterium]
MYLLASNCNRAGLSQSDTEILCTQHFDLPEREIKDSVNSASNTTTPSLQSLQTLQKQRAEQQPSQPDDDPLEDYLKTTPTIPDEVYEALPHILKEGARAFTDKRKQDVFFTGAISIISGCLPKVTVIYFNERVYPLIHFHHSGASGKGVLKMPNDWAISTTKKFYSKAGRHKKYMKPNWQNIKGLEFKKTRRASTGKTTTTPFKIVFIPRQIAVRQEW